MCGVVGLLALSSCAAPAVPGTSGSASGAGSETTASSDSFPGVGDVSTVSATLLHSGACVAATGSLTITLSNNETAYLTLRPSDNTVIVNSDPADANCVMKLAPTAALAGAFPAGKTISIVSSAMPTGTDTRAVILDYANGIFGESASGSAGVISINLGADSPNNTVKVRGTATDDNFFLGKGSGAMNAPTLFNVNGGLPVGMPPVASLDSIPDVTFLHVANVIMSTGPGADKINADGKFGTTAPYPTAVKMFGGDGDDTLTGGAGNDVLSGDLGIDTMTGGAGSNTYAMGAVPQGADIISVYKDSKTNVYAVDTVDYSLRSGAVTVTLTTVASATSGEGTENATIPDTVSTVIGGFGNDTISAAGSVLNHTLKGGPGNDTLTGSTGAGLDKLIGGNDTVTNFDGNDTFIGAKATVDYSARTSPLTVYVDSAGNATSGDVTSAANVVAQAAVVTVSGTFAAPANSQSVVTNLSGMLFGTPSSAGNVMVVTGTTGGVDDGTYRIVSCSSATSCIIDVSSNPNFAADTSNFTYDENTRVRTSQAATASVAGTITATGAKFTGLANMNAASVGHYLTITAPTIGGNASTGVGFKILTVVDPTTVTVAPGAVTLADDVGFTWAEKIVGDETDSVQAGSVIGSLTAINKITAIDGGTHRITGGGLADILTGGVGADTLYGLAGDDFLYGGSGDDTLMGGDGDDHLFGGDGNDLLDGDAGQDTFICDGKNSATVNGLLPGNVDLTVDYGAMTDLPAMPTDCDF